MAIVSELLGFIDGAITGAAEDAYTTVAGNFGGVVTIVATLAFIVFGLMLSLGIVTARTGDLFQFIFRIILIFAFGLTWNNFAVLYDTLTNTSDSLVSALFSVSDQSGAASTVELADEFATQAQTTAASVIRAEGTITRGFLGAVMYLLLAALQAAYILVAGFSKIMIGLLIGLAPFAITATCFRKTQFLFEAWLSSLIGYFLYPVAAAGVMGFIVAAATRAFDQRSDTTLIGITGVVVIIIVGIYALYKIPSIAANITGKFDLAGIAPEALRIVSAPAVKAGTIGGSFAGQVASGSTTGGETKQRAQQTRRFGSATDLKAANLGARLADNSLGRFVQRRRDLQFARAANERLRAAKK